MTKPFKDILKKHLHELKKMNGKFPYKLAQIRDYGGDLKKTWHVEYYVWNHSDEVLNRKRISFNDPTAKSRRIRMAEVRDEINEQLKTGVVVNRKANHVPTLYNDTAVIDAILFFVKFVEKTTKPRSYESYKSDLKRINTYLELMDLNSININEFDTEMAFNFADYLTVTVGIKNRYRNTIIGRIKVFFNFLKKRKLIQENPFANVKNLPFQTSKHHVFIDAEVKLITDWCLENDPGLYIAISFIYFGFIRSGYELRHLKIGNIKAKTIEVEGEIAKNSKTDHVMIPKALEEIIVKNELRSYDPEFYVFSPKGPGLKLAEKNHWYRRHVKALAACDLLGKNHDFYSWKHTGVCKLYAATQNIELIRKQCRHSDIATTQLYMRDLGLFTNYDEIDKFPAF